MGLHAFVCLWGFFCRFFPSFFHLPLSSWPWHDRLARLLKWSGCPVLKEDLSHYKQKWRGQSNHCSRLRTLCQCQTLCCLDSAHWGSGAGIWECTKGPLNHQIVAATEREGSTFPPEWDVFFIYLFFFNYHDCCMLPLWKFSCISCSWFPHCLFWPSSAWHPLGIDKHLQFLHSSGK